MATRATSALAGSFAGELLAPGDGGYDDARQVWNGAIDRRPALIARCSGVADVVAALRHAREHDLLVAVRGGGHGVAGQAVCDDGIVIDLSPMRGIEVDPTGRTARAQGGVLWGELDAATQEHGLATVGGIVTHTGIAGLTLGGGIGWLMRRHGATVDNLLAAEVVTARGDVLRASADEHPDLFWGLRGGGGNFGVVTSFEYRVHEVGPIVLSGPIFYALEDGPEVLRFYRELIAEAPDELTTIVNLRRAPALPFVPAELHGRPVVAAIVCYAGAVQRGEQVLAPLRRFGRPLLDAIAPRPYVELQQLFNPGVPHGWHYYWKSWELPPLSDGAIDTLVEHAARITSPRSYVIVFSSAAPSRGWASTRPPTASATRRTTSTSAPCGFPTTRRATSTPAGRASATRRSSRTPPAARTSTSSPRKAGTACAQPTARSATRGSWRSSAPTTPATSCA